MSLTNQQQQVLGALREYPNNDNGYSSRTVQGISDSTKIPVASVRRTLRELMSRGYLVTSERWMGNIKLFSLINVPTQEQTNAQPSKRFGKC